MYVYVLYYILRYLLWVRPPGKKLICAQPPAPWYVLWCPRDLSGYLLADLLKQDRFPEHF